MLCLACLLLVALLVLWVALLYECPKFDLEGKAVLITGGSGHIGRALVAEFLRRKVSHIYVLDRVPPPIEHPQVRFYECDLANEAGLLQLLAKLPPLPVIVHAAGLSGYAELVSAQQVMAVNFQAMLALWTYFLRNTEADTAFVCIGSAIAFCGARNLEVYCASKYAVRGFFECIRRPSNVQGRRTLLVSPFAVSGGGLFRDNPHFLFAGRPCGRIQKFFLWACPPVTASTLAIQTCEALVASRSALSVPGFLGWMEPLSRLLPLWVYDWILGTLEC